MALSSLLAPHSSLLPLNGNVRESPLCQSHTSFKWFRNHADFHEACTLAIGMRLAKVLAPRWLRIGGYWYPRGGMPIDVFWQTGKLPKDVWVPDQGVAPYRGRG